MRRDYFLHLEKLAAGTSRPLDDVLLELAFNDDGLIPVVVQDIDSRDVLMLAWMNRVALDATLETQRMTYWSRSRNTLWVKGESSGNVQSLQSMHFDCDGDTVLCLVKQTGAACHTNRDNCFYLKVDSASNSVSIESSSTP